MFSVQVTHAVPVLTTIEGIRVEAFTMATVPIPRMATVLSGRHGHSSHTMIRAGAGTLTTLNICRIKTPKSQVKEEISDTLFMNSTALFTLIVAYTVLWVRKLFSILYT